ncbi:uncharacterized protein PG998_014416 [Apiospora kogelbergensis]|uniref:uncharacterized protein n=1 Tax=Apiospora kogelbergensis TaxID=1337665 RepID=UPI003130E861
MNPIAFESATEARFFHHFRLCTRFGLAYSAGPLDFWDTYVLPVAHQEDYLRQAVAAVGAAHQSLVVRSYAEPGSSTWNASQENAAMQQYNRAIASLVRAISSPNPVAAAHGALLCCLMFVCFESLMGRYSESIKHMQSGCQLLTSLGAASRISDAGLWRHTYGMFARLALEFSAFMDAPLAPALPSNMLSAMVVENQQPFSDLNEALLTLRTMANDHFIALHKTERQHLLQRTRSPNLAGEMVRVDPYAQLPRGTSMSPVSSSSGTCGPLWEGDWSDSFSAWNRRFELTVQNLCSEDISERDRGMLAHLRLQQNFWEMEIELTKNGGNAAVVASEACEECLQRAESLAQPLIAHGKPTFSLDGDLISDLCFIISVCQDLGQQNRALSLLRSLNRREGIWDSNEIAEMHSFSLSLGVANLWGEDKELGYSVPAFMRSLSRMSQKAYIPRAALVSMAEFICQN